MGFICTAVGEGWSVAETLEGLAMVAAVEGDSQQAAVLYGAAEALSERLGALHHAFDSVFATSTSLPPAPTNAPGRQRG